MFNINVNKNQLVLQSTELVTSNSVNVNEVKFTFSTDWNCLDRVAIFKTLFNSINVVLDQTNTCKIPWEVLTKEDYKLYVGVYGTNNSNTVLTTTWLELTVINYGASLGNGGTTPTIQCIYTVEDKQKLASLNNYNDTELRQLISGKQTTLVSGTNIKTINNESILGSGNIVIQGGSADWEEIEGKPFESVGQGLKVVGSILQVDTTDYAEQDNTKPITSSGVNTIVGNINALLSII